MKMKVFRVLNGDHEYLRPEFSSYTKDISGAAAFLSKAAAQEIAGNDPRDGDYVRLEFVDINGPLTTSIWNTALMTADALSNEVNENMKQYLVSPGRRVK